MKLIKYLRLWLNAWLYKQSEEEIRYLTSLNLDLSAKANRHRVRQQRLRKQRERIVNG